MCVCVYVLYVCSSPTQFAFLFYTSCHVQSPASSLRCVSLRMPDAFHAACALIFCVLVSSFLVFWTTHGRPDRRPISVNLRPIPSEWTSIDTDWEYLRGDLGGPWEALRSTAHTQVHASKWEAVSLPHSFNALDAVNPDVPYYQGPGWYRRRLWLKNPYDNGRTVLRFLGAGQKTRLYVEDHFVGEHVGGYDEFEFDITDATQRLGDPRQVTVLVRCDNTRDLELMPSDLSDFNLYGGLYRPVHLVYRPSVYVAWPVVDCAVDEAGRDGVASFEVAVEDPGHERGRAVVKVEILDPSGAVVYNAEATVKAGQEVLRLRARVARPRLWSPEAPHLYAWNVTSVHGSGAQYERCGRLGFRHFRFERHGPFHLNGRRLLLRGTHRHEDHAGLAAAMPEALIREELSLMKAMGVNFIRLGHYQQHRHVLDLCDELGLLVWEEIPWCRGGLGGARHQAQGRRMLRRMIAQHRHHPSVILWGLGNEADWPGDARAFDKAAVRGFMAELNALAHELDPARKTATRRCAFCADIADVYSPSIWAGWYRGRYTDYKSVSQEEMEKVDHFLHVEWGASHHARRHSEDPDKALDTIRSGEADERAGDFLMTGGEARVSKDGDWTETYACNLIDWYLKEQETMPWLTGTAYWPFKDFSTPIRPDNPVPYVNQKGVVERDLTPKESFYVFQSYWTQEPMVRIYGHTWPVRWGQSDEPKMVKVYSNCDEVRLYLNGKPLGLRQRASQNFPAAGLRWVTTFSPGMNRLEAVGYRGGGAVVKDVVEFQYQSTLWSAPARLHLKLLSETEETATVEVYALDQEGVRCLDAKNVVAFALVGDGELIADLGTSTASRKVELYNGRAQIAMLNKGGRSVIGVTSRGLPSQFLTIGQVQGIEQSLPA